MDYTILNAKTINSWVEDGWQWGKSITSEEYQKALNGEWGVYLTPTKFVPKEWFGEIKDKKILGLASGGGQQMPIFAALGADCTVLDYSDKQIESEKVISEREGYDINIIQADMTKRLPFEDETFDIIFHPVSNCYVEEVKPIWNECFRVLKKGGRLLSGLDIGINYIVSEDEKEIINSLPFNPLKDKKILEESIKRNDGIQFSHTLEEQINGQLEAGFLLKSLYEDTNGQGHLHNLNIPSFIATYSTKPL